MGMRNHELVSGALCVLIAQLEKGGCHKILDALCQRRLVAYEVKQKLGWYVNVERCSKKILLLHLK